MIINKFQSNYYLLFTDLDACSNSSSVDGICTARKIAIVESSNVDGAQ